MYLGWPIDRVWIFFHFLINLLFWVCWSFFFWNEMVMVRGGWCWIVMVWWWLGGGFSCSDLWDSSDFLSFCLYTLVLCLVHVYLVFIINNYTCVALPALGSSSQKMDGSNCVVYFLDGSLNRCCYVYDTMFYSNPWMWVSGLLSLDMSRRWEVSLSKLVSDEVSAGYWLMKSLMNCLLIISTNWSCL